MSTEHPSEPLHQEVEEAIQVILQLRSEDGDISELVLTETILFDYSE